MLITITLLMLSIFRGYHILEIPLSMILDVTTLSETEEGLSMQIGHIICCKARQWHLAPINNENRPITASQWHP